MNVNQIPAEFISLLSRAGENNTFRCQLCNQSTRRRGRNVTELSGSINYLVYFKMRSG